MHVITLDYVAAIAWWMTMAGAATATAAPSKIKEELAGLARSSLNR
jgi:hypothetical protein